MNNKYFKPAGLLFLLVFIISTVNYIEKNNEDETLRDEFLRKNKNKIESSLRQLRFINHNQNESNNLLEFLFQGKIDDLKYKHEMGVISKEIFDKEFKVLIDKQLKESMALIDEYSNRVKNVDITK